MKNFYKFSKITAKCFATLFLVFNVNHLLAQITYTFTSAGATGKIGPTQAQLNTAYASTNLSGSVTSVSGIQTWTVPLTGPYRIQALGAQGGSESVSKYGGRGASMVGDFTLTAGTVLKILVGQKGSSVLTYYGGGGGSFVATITNTPLIVAGGGGGAGGTAGGNGVDASITTSGTAGSAGGTGGVNGNGGAAVSTNGGSGGGFYSDGTTSGILASCGLAFINGGTGGQYSTWLPGGFGGGGGGWSSTGNGGGGGGYSGGGTSGSTYVGGGGGGSYNSGTNQVNTAGVNTGDGKVTITLLYAVNISQTSSINCNGFSTAALSSTVAGGVAPYTYTWSPSGANTTTLSNLGAGVYTLTVTDANNLVTSSTYTVTQPGVLAATATQTNLTCFGSGNGVASVSVTGGTAPYTYSWSPTGGTSATATGLAANSYTCVIRDANLCPVLTKQ